MSIGSIDLVTITRSQDYTAIKHAEDNKSIMQQTNASQRVQKDSVRQSKEVVKKDNSDWNNSKYDAKEKGKNEYYGNGGKEKKKQGGNESKDRVILNKEHKGFDIKI